MMKSVPKKIINFVWIPTLIFFSCYILWSLITDRINVKKYYFSSVKQNGEWVKFDDITHGNKKLNSLTVKFSELAVNQGETTIKGNLNISFYHPEKSSSVTITFILERPIPYGKRLINVNCNMRKDKFGTNSYGHKKLTYIPSSGSHLNYPFDDLFFNLPFEIKPKIKFDKVSIVTRVENFYIKKNPVITESNSGLSLSFKIGRSRSLQITFFVIALSISVYVFLIIRYVSQLEILVGTITSYFVSVWSIRALFGRSAMVFPTILDIYLILMSVVLMVGLLNKIIYRKIKFKN